MVCTLDGDGQNPPAEIPRLLAALGGNPGVFFLIGGKAVFIALSEDLLELFIWVEPLLDKAPGPAVKVDELIQQVRAGRLTQSQAEQPIVRQRIDTGRNRRDRHGSSGCGARRRRWPR